MLGASRQPHSGELISGGLWYTDISLVKLCLVPVLIQSDVLTNTFFSHASAGPGELELAQNRKMGPQATTVPPDWLRDRQSPNSHLNF